MAADRKSLVEKATSQIGYKESANNDNIYGRWYGMNNQPWCAMFVSWCAAQCGISEDIILKFAYVPYGVDFFKKKGRYKPADGRYKPQPGDIVFFGNSDHVGIVEKVQGSNIITIEGNTSAGSSGSQTNGEGVYRRTRSLKGGWTMGYGVPDLEEEEEVNKREIKIKSEDTGVATELSAILVDGENYIRLRDLEKIFPVKIGYEESTKTPTFNLVYK